MNTSFDANLTGRSAPVSRGSQGIKRILVCMDFSAHSEECLQQASFVARACESDITLLHVMQPLSEHPGLHATDAVGWEISRQQAMVTLEGFEKKARAASQRPVATRLDQGRAAERIAVTARDLDADLVVLGSHGEGDLPTINLGSTAQQVLSLTQSSLLLARAPGSAQERFAPQRILVPLDGSPRTESTIPTVARLAKESGAEVLLAHVVLDPLPTEVLRDADDLNLARDLATRLESHAKSYLARIAENLRRDVDRVRSVVLRNTDQPQMLLELLEKEHIDLVMLSAHGATCNRERAFGSVTTHLLAYGPVPIVVLQDLSEEDLHVTQRLAERAPRRPAPQPRGSA
jgi:nucleotide-binding universal stress UspA family protein